MHIATRNSHRVYISFGSEKRRFFWIGTLRGGPFGITDHTDLSLARDARLMRHGHYFGGFTDIVT